MDYHTEPLETYNWGKEMRLKHLKAPITAKEEGKFLVAGNMNFPKEVITAIGDDFVYLAGEPWSVSISREGQPENMATQVMEEVERRGFMRDMCSYMRLYWGSMFLNKSPWGGYPRPDLITFQADCDTRAKWYQGVYEHLGVPWYCVEGTFHRIDGTLTPKEHAIRYLMDQYEEFIQWLVKFTGRPYREDILVKCLANAYRSRAYWGEVCQMQAHSPAPLDYKLLLPFFLAVEWHPYEEETVRMFHALRDEVKYRIEQGITPVPKERKRITHDGLAPWYALYLYTYIRQQDVTVLGNLHLCFLSPVQKLRPDGLFHPEDPVNWEGVPKNKEEGLRFRAMHQFFIEKGMLDTQVRIMYALGTMKYWKVDGAIFMMDRGCEWLEMGQPEVRAAVQRNGTPVMVYETNRVDSSEWSWSQIQDTTDAFLESLGVPLKTRT